MKIEEGYLGVEDVISRGWTRGLITQYLGHPDRMFPVNHWKNYSGKYAWRVSTVELAEMSQGFERGFLHSARIRRLSRFEIEDVIDRIYLLREVGLTPEPVETDPFLAKLNACADYAAGLFAEARHRGYRTPHKC
jgi:hypothetical protein